MAVIDPNRNAVVIRIVYDGPPMAGKTTSVQTLAKGLGGKVVVPEEIDGRTVFFDWLDYTGGLFEGRQIRCQIISVPGQATLASRRRHLLESADVVVFVGDSRHEQLPVTRQYLTGLDSVLKSIPGPPVGIVFQANKRDHENAADLADVRALLAHADLQVAILESIATTGHGIRETFVFAVRLALDRVRELLRTGELASSPPTVDCAEDLLGELARIEGGALKLAVESGLTHTSLGEIHSRPLAADVMESVLKSQTPQQAAPAPVDEDRPPVTPDQNLPSGMIWPPVAGRMILHEAISDAVKPKRDAHGGWSAVIDDRWILKSHANARYADLDAGRAALVEWARMHVGCLAYLSPRRCVVLAEDQRGSYRLWQLIGREVSLRDALKSSLEHGVESIANALADSVERMIRAASTWSDAPIRIPLSLRTTAASSDRPTYTGAMPDSRNASPATPRTEHQILQIMASELAFAVPALSASRNELVSALENRNASLALQLVRQLARDSSQQ